MSDGAQFALYAMMLVLPLSALFARRLALGHAVKLALGWAAIFAVCFMIVGNRDLFRSVWDKAFPSEQRVVGSTVRIDLAPDGHFYARAAINGISRRMLIDSGATTSALSVETASAAGVVLDASPFTVALDTANGTVQARRARISKLDLGDITARDLAVVVAPEFGDTDVLGMNFLSQLRGWRVEGRTLVLDATNQ